MNTVLKEYSGLTCRVIDALPANQQPKRVVFLCHGFGAPGDDLASFGPQLLNSHPSIAQNCRLIFPEAPVDLSPFGVPGGRAWWPINMAQLAAINETRDYAKLSEVVPDGMRAASIQLCTAISEAMSEIPNQTPALTIGGFSQGAMVSTDVVLKHGLSVDQLILYSGTMLCREEWVEGAEKHSGCQVLQSHGKQDMVLPFEPATWLKDTLVDNGFDVDFIEFDGDHTIPMPALQKTVELLASPPSH